jgi:hypothetical protein
MTLTELNLRQEKLLKAASYALQAADILIIVEMNIKLKKISYPQQVLN